MEKQYTLAELITSTGGRGGQARGASQNNPGGNEMRITDARQVLHEVSGKGYTWLQGWGISTIREAIRTIRDRKSATREDAILAEQIETVLSRKH